MPVQKSDRQGGEQSKVARLGVHFPNLKGQRPGCPSLCASCPRRDGRPSFWRPSRALPAEKEPSRGSDVSRPRPVGGVNELVKYADIDWRGHAKGGAGHAEKDGSMSRGSSRQASLSM